MGIRRSNFLSGVEERSSSEVLKATLLLPPTYFRALYLRPSEPPTLPVTADPPEDPAAMAIAHKFEKTPTDGTTTFPLSSDHPIITKWEEGAISVLSKDVPGLVRWVTFCN